MLKDSGAEAGDQNQQLMDQLNHANELIWQRESEIERLNLSIKQLTEDMERMETDYKR